MKKILIAAAHPDDEVLGCGGVIAKEIETGSKVKVVIFASGVTSRYKEVSAQIRTEIEKLYSESRKANAILGVKKEDVIFGDFPDQQMDTVPFLEIAKFISSIANDFKPDTIYTHHPKDLNLDHRLVADAVLVVSRPFGDYYPKEVYAFEALSSTEWGWNERDIFKPAMYVDISGQIAKKKDALKAYVSELKKYPHPRSVEGVDILAKHRGLEVGLEYAESFEVIRIVK